MARHNAKLYGVAHKIDFICGDFFDVAGDLVADGVFLSPPWGGPLYKHCNTFDLHTQLEGLPVTMAQLMAISAGIVQRRHMQLQHLEEQQQQSQEGIGGGVDAVAWKSWQAHVHSEAGSAAAAPAAAGTSAAPKCATAAAGRTVDDHVGVVASDKGLGAARLRAESPFAAAGVQQTAWGRDNKEGTAAAAGTEAEDKKRAVEEPGVKREKDGEFQKQISFKIHHGSSSEMELDGSSYKFCYSSSSGSGSDHSSSKGTKGAPVRPSATRAAACGKAADRHAGARDGFMCGVDVNKLQPIIGKHRGVVCFLPRNTDLQQLSALAEGCFAAQECAVAPAAPTALAAAAAAPLFEGGRDGEKGPQRGGVAGGNAVIAAAAGGVAIAVVPATAAPPGCGHSTGTTVVRELYLMPDAVFPLAGAVGASAAGDMDKAQDVGNGGADLVRELSLMPDETTMTAAAAEVGVVAAGGGQGQQASARMAQETISVLEGHSTGSGVAAAAAGFTVGAGGAVEGGVEADALGPVLPHPGKYWHVERNVLNDHFKGVTIYYGWQ
jgi:hypothetical protein